MAIEGADPAPGGEPRHDPAAYGAAFADVYDDWYGARAGTDAAVARLAELAPGPRLLELGVGTGRLAIPLAAAGFEVHGIDGSPAMLERLAAKPGGDRVQAHVGDLADADGPGHFDLVFVTDNTLFNLPTAELQQRCFARVAARLLPGGRFVVEAFVPGDDLPRRGVEPRAVGGDEVVLSAWEHDAASQTVVGQYVTMTASGNRLRPWRIRYATPDQLDALAGEAGLQLEERGGGWDDAPFTAASTVHVSVYRRPAR